MKKQNRKGVSVMIGYILLIVFAIIISSIVFLWLRTYIPYEGLSCPDGVSLLIENAEFHESTGELIIKITNNGRFNVEGYFISIKNDSEQDLATIEIWNYLNENESGAGGKFGGSVSFNPAGENSLEPEGKVTHLFDLPSELGIPDSITIIPTRFQEYEERKRFVNCGDALVTASVMIMYSLIVFVSSPATYKGDFGGLEEGDDICMLKAGESQLEKVKNGIFVAWLSNDTVNARDRIENGAYILTNGTVVAKNKAELTSGNLLSKINLDESGTTRAGRVWTGTNEFGIATGKNCDNWKSSSSTGTRGDTGETNGNWTIREEVSCEEGSRLYCFQIK